MKLGVGALVALSLAACQGSLNPALVQGEYQAQLPPAVQMAGGPAAKPVILTLKLAPNEQAVVIHDYQDGKTEAKTALWRLSGNKVTVDVFKMDPHRKGSKMLDTVLVLTAKRSTRTLWLEDQQGGDGALKGLEFKKQ